MRSFATLLLLLLALPALVLPAGLWLHVCRCLTPVRDAALACCAVHSAPEAAPTCCGSRKPTDDGSPLRVVPKCGCEWIALADDRPDSSPPEPAALPTTTAATTVVAFVLRAEAMPPHPAWARTTSRAPPGQQRNLPLRS